MILYNAGQRSARNLADAAYPQSPEMGQDGAVAVAFLSMASERVTENGETRPVGRGSGVDLRERWPEASSGVIVERFRNLVFNLDQLGH